MVQADDVPVESDGAVTLSLVERLTAARKGARTEEDAKAIADAQNEIERLRSQGGVVRKDALPRKDVEGAAYSIGDRVEKYTGEATYVGTVVSVYLTVRRKLRYVVDVEPQRFQMISSEAQLRPAAIRSLGKPTGGE